MDEPLGLRLALLVTNVDSGDVYQTVMPPSGTNIPVAVTDISGYNGFQTRLRVVHVSGDWPDYIPAEDRRIRIQFFGEGMSVSSPKLA